MVRILRENTRGWIQGCAAACLFCVAVTGYALTPMDDDQMSEVNGTGLAVGFDDFDFRMAPTSFIELTGSEPSSAADTAGWDRGDARYYGLSFTDADANGVQWFDNDNACGNPDDLCALGSGTITNFAPVNNPYVFRAFDNPGYDPSGTYLDGGSTPTNMELVGPTASDPWRWSFWGELQVDRNNQDGGSELLQSQTIIKGKNITQSGDPSIFRIFQTEGPDETFGFTYQSALSGDFRFSVAQTGSSPDAVHEVPEFGAQEGVVFKNVDAFIPLGRLHSQFFSLNSTSANDGNFVIELSEVPNSPNAYNDIYCGNQGSACTTNSTASDGTYDDTFGNEVEVISNPNDETHGYVRWGNFNNGDPNSICATCTGNGIYFRAPANDPSEPGGAVTNIGVARLDGVLIQSMRLETLGIQ